jgi:hypothetical protein
MKVTCVEGRGTLGGTCLNVGCIPSKVRDRELWGGLLPAAINNGGLPPATQEADDMGRSDRTRRVGRETGLPVA